MKTAKFFSRLFAVIGGIVLLAGVVVCFWFQGGAGQAVPKDAVQAAKELEDAISRGDLEAASRMLSGQPELAGSQEEAGEAGKLVWDAFLGSLSCKATDVCYATSGGVAQDVHITSMDIGAVWDQIEKEGVRLRRENNEESVSAQQLLTKAAKTVLAGQIPTVERDVTLNLSLQDGGWRILPDAALRAALSGGLNA